VKVSLVLTDFFFSPCLCQSWEISTIPLTPLAVPSALIISATTISKMHRSNPKKRKRLELEGPKRISQKSDATHTIHHEKIMSITSKHKQLNKGCKMLVQAAIWCIGPIKFFGGGGKHVQSLFVRTVAGELSYFSYGCKGHIFYY